MPNNIINYVAVKTNRKVKEIEDLWDKAKDIAKEEYDKEDYDIIMGIFKKSLGKDDLEKLNWKILESILPKATMKDYLKFL